MAVIVLSGAFVAAGLALPLRDAPLSAQDAPSFLSAPRVAGPLLRLRRSGDKNVAATASDGDYSPSGYDRPLVVAC